VRAAIFALAEMRWSALRKSGNRFSDKKHDKTKAWSRSAISIKNGTALGSRVGAASGLAWMT
jgi:hypothetical protein